MPFEWKDEYLIGDKEIDDQHKTIFHFLADLEDGIKHGRSDELVRQAIDFLDKYIRDHFKFEEKCMHDRKCPVAEYNQHSHTKFLEAFEKISDKYLHNGDPIQLLREIQALVKVWLVTHIIRIDSHLKNCM